jgi:hypothetical protein
MNLPKRLRNIAMTQINAIKERLDRVDAEADEEALRRRYERDARAELDDITDIRLPRRTPEEIATGRSSASPQRTERSVEATAPIRSPDGAAERDSTSRQPADPLAHHYRVLGVEQGTDFSAVQAAYSKLAARCSPDRFPEGSEERKVAEEIRKRVDASFDALRDALDATAGRFDKLEF